MPVMPVIQDSKEKDGNFKTILGNLGKDLGVSSGEGPWVPSQIPPPKI